MPVSRLRARRHPACRDIARAITVSTPLSSRSSTAWTPTTIAGSACSRARPYSPPDRNLVDIYADAGVEFIGLSDRRPKDKFGIAAAYAHVSPRAQALDVDYQQAWGAGWPVRRFEAVSQASTSMRSAAGGTLQPNLQYIFHPGGEASRQDLLPAERLRTRPYLACARS